MRSHFTFVFCAVRVVKLHSRLKLPRTLTGFHTKQFPGQSPIKCDCSLAVCILTATDLYTVLVPEGFLTVAVSQLHITATPLALKTFYHTLVLIVCALQIFIFKINIFFAKYN
jgi:hypothetical protein